jgi:DNA replication and repair protein RecF
MTGTGRELFDALGDRATYLEVTDGDGGSEVTSA